MFFAHSSLFQSFYCLQQLLQTAVIAVTRRVVIQPDRGLCQPGAVTAVSDGQNCKKSEYRSSISIAASRQVRTTGVGYTHVHRSAATPDRLIRELFFDEVDNRGSERQSLLPILSVERLIRQTSRDPVWIAGRDIIEIKSPCPPDDIKNTVE